MKPSIKLSTIVSRASSRSVVPRRVLPHLIDGGALPSRTSLAAISSTASSSCDHPSAYFASPPGGRCFSDNARATPYPSSTANDALHSSMGARRISPTASTAASNSDPPFRKILIANRGEIAVRVMNTARRLNIRTVAVYSTADASSPHVALADEAVCIGPPASSDSYLDMDKVMEAVHLTGCEAVHPGYGFLSENSKFAELVESMDVNELPHATEHINSNSSSGSSSEGANRKKVKFIGPSANAIQSLGDKIQSKIIADKANVSTIPGYNGVVTSPAHALQVAHDIGYPIMIKASSGGGGKGMRICRTDQQVQEGYRLGSAEAKSFFGDDRLLVEKYVEDPRHIEIQVLGGTNPRTGDLDVLCFAERECSIQRRNQKVIEESPSPHLLPSTRREMIRQVRSLVRDVGYESAGTVEFLVDGHQNFYFLEMNTRLQVEHPVTEMISGFGYASGNYVDLVHGMLEVAAGRGIPQQYLDLVDTEDHGDGDDGEGNNVRYTGHAIEARVYAEDPYRGFLPSTGPLVKYVEPPSVLNVNPNTDPTAGADNAKGESSACHIRIDTGVLPGTIIAPHYDPILSKIISYSPTSRSHAILGLGSALDRYLLRGVQHNVPFVTDVLRNADFVKGYTPTGFIESHYRDGFSGGKLSEGERRELVVIASEIMRKREAIMNGNHSSSSSDGIEVVVCLGGMFGDAYLVRSTVDVSAGSVASNVTRLPRREDGKDNDAVAEETNDEIQLVKLSALEYDPSSDFAQVKVAGESRALQVHGIDEIGTLQLTMYGSNADILILSPTAYQLSCHMKEPIPLDLGNFVLSPMPGTLISFAVKEGDIVEMGQELCVVEAMKMQNVIRSHKAEATVGKLFGEVGTSLRADEILLEFEERHRDCVDAAVS